MGNKFTKGSKSNDNFISLLSKHKDRSTIANRNSIYASSITKCRRKDYLHFNKEVCGVTDIISSLYMNIGTVVHEVVQDALYESGNLLYKEYRLPKLEEMYLSGYVDGILEWKDELFALEIKTCGALPKRVKPQHRKQIAIYCAVTGLRGIVLYVSRNVASWPKRLLAEYHIFDDIAEIDNAVHDLALSSVYIDENVLPNRMDNKSDCEYCSFKSYCWKNENVEAFSLSQQMYEVCSAEARIRARKFYENLQTRRNGILSHISQENKNAKKVLEGANWYEMIKLEI